MAPIKVDKLRYVGPGTSVQRRLYGSNKHKARYFPPHFAQFRGKDAPLLPITEAHFKAQRRADGMEVTSFMWEDMWRSEAPEERAAVSAAFLSRVRREG